jgi:hypothetical protein
MTYGRAATIGTAGADFVGCDVGASLRSSSRSLRVFTPGELRIFDSLRLRLFVPWDGGFTMNHRPLADDHGYRGIEYGVFENNPGDWLWAYYPKVGCGVKTQGSVKGDLRTAVAACKAAIDAWLGARS